MIAYVDASVVLRGVLGQGGHLTEWSTIEIAVSSALVEVECFRTLDRLRHERRVSDEDMARLHQGIYAYVATAQVVDLTQALLEQAARPLPTVLGTLDAIHLATALAWQADQAQPLVMATHDRALAVAARAHGMTVVGV
jgi:predicted nucleic acid-binding protein